MNVLITYLTHLGLKKKKASVKAPVFHIGDFIICIEDVIIVLTHFMVLFS